MPGRAIERVVVIGDGAWGTTLALLLFRSGIKTTLWSAFHEQAEELHTQRENSRYMPGVPLPEELEITADAFEAAKEVDLAFSVVPTQFLRGVAETLEDVLAGDGPVVTAPRGLETETSLTPRHSQRMGVRHFVGNDSPSQVSEQPR